MDTGYTTLTGHSIEIYLQMFLHRKNNVIDIG